MNTSLLANTVKNAKRIYEQPRDNVSLVNGVYKTYDYSKFKTLNGNRSVNRIHVERLKNSFSKNYLVSPLIVNSDYQIIDGQHRFIAASELKLPIYYIIQEEYGLKEVQVYNSNAQNWTKKDYLESYCALGYEQYLKMRKFLEDFPDFGLYAAEIILTNSSRGANEMSYVDTKSKRVRLKSFQEGLLKINDIDLAYENAAKIMMFKPYYDGYYRTVFVSTMINLFKKENYDHDRMMKKLKLNPTALKHCINVKQYKTLLEEIYNYKSRDKVSLIY